MSRGLGDVYKRQISPSKADANATGISTFVILILIPLASRETLLKSATFGHAIRAPGTSTMFSSSLEITGKPSLIAPAPAARTTSSTGLKAFTNAGTLSLVYVRRLAASPGVTLPKISAARSATDTTWITDVTSFPSGMTRTFAPVLYPSS